jgi:hypothetical protein
MRRGRWVACVLDVRLGGWPIAQPDSELTCAWPAMWQAKPPTIEIDELVDTTDVDRAPNRAYNIRCGPMGHDLSMGLC